MKFSMLYKADPEFRVLLCFHFLAFKFCKHKKYKNLANNNDNVQVFGHFFINKTKWKFHEYFRNLQLSSLQLKTLTKNPVKRL